MPHFTVRGHVERHQIITSRVWRRFEGGSLFVADESRTDVDRSRTGRLSDSEQGDFEKGSAPSRRCMHVVGTISMVHRLFSETCGDSTEYTRMRGRLPNIWPRHFWSARRRDH